MGLWRSLYKGGGYQDSEHYANASSVCSYPGGQLPGKAAIKIVVMPSHWIMDIRMQVDAAACDELQADLTWMLHRPYSFVPPEKYHNHYQLAPSDLHQ